MQIYFCERCGRRVSDVDLEKGRGVVSGDVVYCGECATEAAVAGGPAEQGTPAVASQSGSRTGVRHKSSRSAGAERPIPSAKGVPKWIYAVVFGAAGLLIVLILFVFGGSSGDSAPGPVQEMPPVAGPREQLQPEVPAGTVPPAASGRGH